MSDALVENYTKHQVKKRWEDMASQVKKKERTAKNEEIRRIRITGNGVLPDEESPALPSCGARGHDDFEIKEVLLPMESCRPKKKIKKTLSDVQMEASGTLITCKMAFMVTTEQVIQSVNKLKMNELQIRGPGEMDFTSQHNVSETWRRWKRGMEYYLAATCKVKNEAEKVAIFMCMIGRDGQEIKDTFEFEVDEDGSEVVSTAILFNKFEAHCKPRKNLVVDRHRFLTRDQASDTGAEVNVIPYSAYRKIAETSKIDLRKPKARLSAYNELGLIKFISAVDRDENTETFAARIREEYKDVFTGIGCLERPYHIVLDPEVQPVINPPRRVPYGLQDRVKAALDEMCNQGIIVPVDQPTDWVNSMVAVEKKNTDKLRICIDPRPLNKAIKHARSGFWQIPLDDESSTLTTFATPYGRYRVETDIDDILVWGRTREEHDERLEKTLQRARESNLKLNPDKYVSKLEAITSMPTPEDKHGIQRLLGMKDVAWHWTERHEQSFNDIKKLLTETSKGVLKYYDPKQPVGLQVDALETDHRPLVSIITKSLDKAPARLQRMLLRLQRYNIDLQYKPGKELYTADTLSRAHLPTTGESIVVPQALRKDVLAQIHEGHLGIERSKQRARELVFWPGMSKQIEDTVANCSICQELRNSNTKEPMIPHEIPQYPWQIAATDLFTWNGGNYIVVVDYYSRYWEVSSLHNTTSTSVIEKLKQFFARHGIPETLKSDNGPQYSSAEFAKFAAVWKFSHVTSSPKYPQSNGLAEKTVQTVKRTLEKAKRDGKDPYLAMLEQRNTPVGNYKSPAQLSMARRLRSILPCTTSHLLPETTSHQETMVRFQKKQAEQKANYDS
ncbi:hypothetical protein QZH41_006425 [Actinostola sp. cb2023]|nr:hypothetical protein QZH41_006425 [Actinostola sp. cb2023]